MYIYLMKLVKFYNNLFNGDVSILYIISKNLLIFRNNMGVYKIYLPSFFFLKFEKNIKYEFIFLKKYFFYCVFNQIKNSYLFLFKVFFFKIKLKGLGYKIRMIDDNCYQFFMAYNHFFYFHKPANILFWNRGRRVFMLSNNKSMLNNIFYHFLLLKKIDLYERNNAFVGYKKILFFKKRR